MSEGVITYTGIFIEVKQETISYTYNSNCGRDVLIKMPDQSVSAGASLWDYDTGVPWVWLHDESTRLGNILLTF